MKGRILFVNNLYLPVVSQLHPVVLYEFFLGLKILEEIKEARRQRVDCQVYVEPGFSIGSIRETDLISALGNLYQNALEAAAKSRNGFIKTTMFMENEGRFLVISMENSYEGAI